MQTGSEGERRPAEVVSDNAKTESANRAEVTAILIRCGYSVYRSEADCEGADLVVRTPSGEFRAVQLKRCPIVDWSQYGGHNLWMLFPSVPYDHLISRLWFLVPHDHLYDWVERKHENEPGSASHWSYPVMSFALQNFLADWALNSPNEPSVSENSN
jgi:hypothetical protein